MACAAGGCGGRCPPCEEDSDRPCPEDSGCGCPDDSVPPPDTGDSAAPAPLRVALYDDTASPQAGAWAPGLDAIEAAVRAAGMELERIGREALNGEPGLLGAFDALLLGGGYAYPGYTLQIDARGKARIQDFVAGGGVFAGICAGAYMACDQLDYEGETWGDESGYDLDLYPGTCHGPVEEVSSYPDWALATVAFDEHPAFEEAPFEKGLFYAGGPAFPDAPAETELLARYADPGEHRGMPALIAHPYGAGRVLLWGPHPELLAVDGEPELAPGEGGPALYTALLSWAAGR